MINKNKILNVKLYLILPIFIVFFVILSLFLVFKMNIDIYKVLLINSILLIIVSLFIYYIYNYYFKNILFNFFAEQKDLQVQIVKDITMPFVITSINGRIIWANEAFLNISNDFKIGKNIISLFSEIKKEFLYNIGTENLKLLTSYNEFRFMLHIKSINPNDFKNGVNNLFTYKEKLIYIYLEDKTEYYVEKQKIEDDKQVTGLIYIDNYDSVTENMEDSKASMLLAMLDRKLNRYMSNYNGIIKKLEKDKYIFITTKKYVENMISDRFSILDEVKNILNVDNIPITLSIGIGYLGKTVEINYDYARTAIDMALGRGGDQVVVKKGQEIQFFGGKSASTNTNARVRARVKATSFREILDTKDRIFVMGHKNCDIDCFGASIGIYVMASYLGKKVFIVANNVTNDVAEIREKFLNNKNYPNDLFIKGTEALSMMNKDDLLVLVDHNTNVVSDEKDLLSEANSIVIVDHHRMQANTIKETILSYVEPSSSSACELVAEMIKFFDEKIKLKPIEAEALYGGIAVDTLNFTYRVSSKTFEAAAFLKENGADIDEIRKILRTDKKIERIKNQIIDTAEYYKDNFVIASIIDYENDDIQVIASKVANELINIKKMKASIVIYKNINDDKYSLSSRSIDEINVQVLMEKLGGGGHRSQAGATISALNIDEVKNKIKQAIDEMIENKEVK